jgi:hypothetical protein
MIQPKEIGIYFDKKEKRIIDEIGWTGEYHLSAKDILDFLIYLNAKGRINIDD